jgi:hypothetical protein
MTAKPQPGLRSSGAAAPHPWATFADVPAPPRTPPCPNAANPDAALAALAFNANQAFSRMVGVAHTLAVNARDHAHTVADASERSLPPGPVRGTVAGLARLQAEFADDLADAAIRMGRRYGHLAFAFRFPQH